MSLDERWRKSTRSGGASGNCVEVRQLDGTVEVRDSKDPNGPTLAFSARNWQAFADAAAKLAEQ
ncbi:DUF397 domain-containing protein [Dactylosporangium sp. CA-139066]|uniref:DUF397 domain-containing protein n=1 Tax=Dactylosporangium sp. CA-139066 TaxID=3239930 RepID=UPI003D8E17EF